MRWRANSKKADSELYLTQKYIAHLFSHKWHIHINQRTNNQLGLTVKKRNNRIIRW